MDYSKLSDDEIAVKVLIAQDYKLIDDGYGYSIYISDSGRKDTGPKASKQFLFDPCNNPADAWPIIFGKGIGLRKQSNGVWSVTQPGGKWPQYSDKPLRAAMIVFLIMQESE